jgi:opacity protein-like surface antigen
MAAILLLASMPAAAVDGMALEAGQGDGADMGRVALQWNWAKPMYQGSGWQLACYWDLGLGYWHKSGAPGRNEDITEIGLTPVLRLQPNGLEGPYAELGLGVHLMSSTTLGDKSMSTQFQFGNHVGVGYRFGVKRAFDLSYRYQHLSNASIKQPNDGIDFHQVRLQYHF